MNEGSGDRGGGGGWKKQIGGSGLEVESSKPFLKCKDV